MLGELHQNGTCPVRYHFKMNFSNYVFRRHIRHLLPLTDSEMYVFTVLHNSFIFYNYYMTLDSYFFHTLSKISNPVMEEIRCFYILFFVKLLSRIIRSNIYTIGLYHRYLQISHLIFR